MLTAYASTGKITFLKPTFLKRNINDHFTFIFFLLCYYYSSSLSYSVPLKPELYGYLQYSCVT
jgi:hypothetical protein